MHRRRLSAVLSSAALGLGLIALAPLAAPGQIIPKDAASPILVIKGKGEFAAKLNASVMPTGKGWKAATDPGRRFQIMVPEKWKVEELAEGDIRMRVTPPGNAKQTPAQLQVVWADPSDKDPLEVDEEYALAFAEDLSKDPALARRQFKVSDSGYVLARGLKFALAGGTLTQRKDLYRQMVLVYIGEDRVLWLQFTAAEKDFAKYQDDVVKMFASYQNLGVKKISDDL